MKKAVTLFLLFIFLFNTAGYYFVYKSAQYRVKKEMQSEIISAVNSGKLKNITINKNNLQDIEWLENGKEMRYNNQFYDIVKSSETFSTITFYCINDTKEDALFTNLEEHINTHVASNKPIKNENQKKLSDNVIKLYFSNEHSFKFNIASLYQHNFFPTNLIFKSSIIETDSPPPEFV